MEGALALVRKLQPKDQESVGYTLLVEYFQSLKKFAILPYDSNAETRFQEFPDFSEIPGLKFEDWTE